MALHDSSESLAITLHNYDKNAQSDIIISVNELRPVSPKPLSKLKLREKVLDNTFQVHIDSKENHNPDVGCPQYKCKVNIKYCV